MNFPTREIGSITGCLLTSQQPYFYGVTASGIHFYMDAYNVRKGFKMFHQYKLLIFPDTTELTSLGVVYRARIACTRWYIFTPEWLRLRKLQQLVCVSNPAVGDCILKQEKVVVDRIGAVANPQYSLHI